MSASAIDHCTFWPDALAGVEWGRCCAAHDLAYATGLDRSAADIALYSCVLQATHAAWFAGLMFAGVSLFGWIFWKKAAG